MRERESSRVAPLLAVKAIVAGAVLGAAVLVFAVRGGPEATPDLDRLEARVTDLEKSRAGRPELRIHEGLGKLSDELQRIDARLDRIGRLRAAASAPERGRAEGLGNPEERERRMREIRERFGPMMAPEGTGDREAARDAWRERFIERQLSRLTEQIPTLTDAQVGALREAYVSRMNARREAMGSLRREPDFLTRYREATERLEAEHDERVKGILDAGQYEIYRSHAGARRSAGEGSDR